MFNPIRFWLLCNHLAPPTVARRVVLTQLEPGTAALAHAASVHRACRARCWRAVRARTLIRLALTVVGAHLPPSIARGHGTPR